MSSRFVASNGLTQREPDLVSRETPIALRGHLHRHSPGGRERTASSPHDDLLAIPLWRALLVAALPRDEMEAAAKDCDARAATQGRPVPLTAPVQAVVIARRSG